MFKLKENMARAQGVPDVKDMEDLITSEIVTSPLDVSLRVKLLRLLLHIGRVRDAYNNAFQIEEEPQFIAKAAYSIQWQSCMTDVMKAYHQDRAGPVDELFLTKYLLTLDQLTILMLHNPNSSTLFAVSGSKDIEPYKQGEQSLLDDAVSVIKSLDDLLKEAHKKKFLSGSWNFILQHFTAQLYLHMATLVLKNPVKVSCNWQVAHRWAAALLLNAYAAHPPSALSQEDWFLALDSGERNLYHNICLRAHHRLSVSGHILHILCNAEDKSSWLSDIKQEVCTPEVRNRIYRSIFDEKGKTSWFLQDTTFTNCTTEFPSPAALYKHDQESQWLHPSSLDHLAWLALQWSYLQDKKHAVIEQCFELQVFEKLPLKPHSFTSGAAETLSQVDVQAFLEATCYCASQALGRKAFPLGQGPLALPPHVGMQLCTGSQADWWSAAYHMYASSCRSEMADVRRILQRGLEVIRAIGNHGMDLSLVVHLARIFANKSSHRHADGLEEEAEAFQDQAARYWEAVLTMLETYRITRSPVTPSGRLFCVPGGRGATSLQELRNIKQEAKMFLAMCAMNSGCLDEAAEMFSEIMTAQAAYYTALVMEKMACKASRRGARYTLLLKERAALQLALERGCRQSDWTLISTVSAQLDDLQERLNLTSVTNGYHDDDNNDEPSRGGQGDSLHLSAHSSASSVHWARQSSTPKPDKSFYPACTPPEKSPTSEATLESLSCQPRSAAAVEAPAIASRFLELQLHSISLHQELAVSRLHGMQEASQSLIKEQLDNHRAVLAEVKQQKAAMEQLTKKIDEVAATTAMAADAALCSQRQNEGSEHRDEQVSGRGLEHNYSRYETAASSRATPRMARSRRRTALPLSVPHVQGPAYGSYSMPHFGHSFASQHLGQALACHFAWQLFLSPQGTIALSTVPTPFPGVAGQFANDNSRPPPSTVSASSTPSRVVNADELPMPTTTTNALPIWGGAGGSPQTAPPSFPTSTFITPSTMAAYCQAVSAPQPGAVETTAPLASTPNDQAPFTAFGTETERGNQRLSPFSLKSFDINRLPPSTLSASSAPFHFANGDVVEASNFSHHAEPQLPAVVAAIPTKSLHPPHCQAICQQTTDSKGADDSNSSPGSILTTYAANSKATTFPDSMSCFSAPGTVSAPSLFGSKASTTATPAQLYGSQMAVSSASVTGGTALPIPTSSLSTSKMVLASSVSGSITYGKATSTQPLDLPLSMCSTATVVAPLFTVPNLCFSTPKATPAASMFGAATATRMTPALSSGLPVTTSTVAAIYTVATTSTTFSVSAIGTSAAMLAPSMFEPTTGTTVAPAASTTAITIPTKFSALTPSVLSFDSQGTTPAVSGSFYTGMSRLHATTFDNFSRSPESSTCTCNVNNGANRLACQVHGLKKQDIVGHKTAEFSQPAIELNAVASTPDVNAPTKLFDMKGLVFTLGASALSHNLPSFGGVFGGSRASGNEEFGQFQFGSTPKATEYRTNVVDSAAIATTAKEPSHSVLDGNVTLSGRKEPMSAASVLGSTATSANNVSKGFEVTSSLKVGAFSKERMPAVAETATSVPSRPGPAASTSYSSLAQKSSSTVFSEPVSTASSIVIGLPREKVSIGTETVTCEPPLTLHVNQQLLPNGPSLLAGSSSLPLGGENDKKQEHRPFDAQPIAAGNLTNSTPSPDKKEPKLARPVLGSADSSSRTVCSEPLSTASSIVVELPRGKVSIGTETATFETPVPSLVVGSSSLPLGGENKEKAEQKPFNAQPVAAGNLTNSTPSPDKKEPKLARPMLGSAASSSGTVSSEPVSTASSIMVELPRGKVSTGTQTATQTVSGTVSSEPVSTASSILVELPRGKVSTGTQTATCEPPVPSLVAGSSSLLLGGENDKEKEEQNLFNVQPVAAGNLTNSTPSPGKKEPKLARPVLGSAASSSGTVSSEPVSTASSIMVELPRGKVSTGMQTATQTVSGTVSSEPVSTASSIVVELPRGKVSIGTETATFETPVPSLVVGSSSLPLGGENKEKAEQKPFNAQPVAAGNLTNSTPSPDKKEPKLARPMLGSAASSSGTVSSEPVSTASSIMVELPRGKVSTGTQTATQTVSGTVSSEPVSTASSILVELPRGKVSTGTQTATCEPPVPSLVAGSSSLLLGGENDKEKEEQNLFNVQPVAAGNLTNSTPSPGKKEPKLARPVLGSAASSSGTVSSEPVSTASSIMVELPRGKVSTGMQTATQTVSGTVSSEPVSTASSILVELPRGKVSTGTQTATCEPPVPSLVAGSSSLLLGGENDEKAEHNASNAEPVAAGNLTNATPSPDKKEPKLAIPVLGSTASSSTTVCSEPVSTASSIVVELPRGKVSIGTEIATCEPRVSCLVAGSSSLLLGEENDEAKEEHRLVNTQQIAAGHLNSSATSPDKKEPKSTRPVLGSMASSSGTVCSVPVSTSSSIVVELSRGKMSIDVETATGGPPTPSLVAGSSSLPLGAESKEKAEHKPFDVQPFSTGNFTNSTPSPDKKEPKLARPVLGSVATSSRTVCSEPVSTASSIVVERPRGKVSIGTEIATCEPRVSCLVAGSSSLLLGEENDEEKEEHRPVNTQQIEAGHLNSSTCSPDKKEPKSTRPVLGSTASSSNTVCSEPVSPASSIVVELSRGKASIDVETATSGPPTPSLVAGSSSLPLGAESKEKAEHKPFDVQPVSTGYFTNSTPSPDKKEPKLARPVLGSVATSSRTVCSEPVSTASSIVVELPRGKVSIGTEIATCEPRVSCLVAGSSSLLLGVENDEEKEEHRPVDTQQIAAGHLNSSTSSPDKKEPKSTRPVLGSTASSSNTVCSEPVSSASSIVVELSRGKASIDVETATCRPPTPSPVTGSSSLLLGGKNDKEKEEPIANRGPALSSSSNYDNASKLSSAHAEPEEPMFLFGVTLPNRKQLDSVTTAHVGTTFGDDAFTCSICVDQNVKEVSCQLTGFGGFLSVGPQNVEQISEDPEQVSSFVTVDTVMELPTSSSSVESLLKSTTIAKREESTELPSAANVNVSLSSPLGGTMSTTQIASTSHAFEFGVTLPDQRASVSLSSSYPDTTSMSEKNVFSLKNTTIVSGHKATPIDVAGADVELANSSSCVRLLSNGSTIAMKDESAAQSHLSMTATGDAETIKLSSTPNKLELQVAFPLPLEPQVTSPQAKPSASTLGTIRQQADSLQSTGEAAEDFESSALLEPMVSLPELMEITTGEEDEDVLFCERAKLSQFDAGTKQWKEHGIGLLESEDKPCDKNLAAQFRTQEQADVFKQTFESCKDKAQSIKTLKEDAGEGKSGATQQQADMKRPQELAATMQDSLNSYACDELAPYEEMHAPYETLTYGKLANEIASLRGYIAENINVPASNGMSSPLSTACSGISPGMSTSGISSASSTPQFVNLSPEARQLASRVVSSTIKPLKPMLDTLPLHTLASPSSFAFEMTICKSSSKPATSTPVATVSTVASGLQLSATQSESGCTSSRDGSTESSPRRAGMDSCHTGTSRRGVGRSLFGTATTAKKSSKHGGKQPRRTSF
ncbi:platelet binding protein GspB-like [Dermacentor albipictus]|uniref:platelet binding protein GspB-like n=1 Tax=Dermacentor albipictus TaxID=60249 RepID=UPI0031FCBD78